MIQHSRVLESLHDYHMKINRELSHIDGPRNADGLVMWRANLGLSPMIYDTLGDFIYERTNGKKKDK